MTDSFLTTLGLCAKAGKCVFGEEACVDTIRAEKAMLVLMDDSAGPNTSKRIKDACAFRSVELLCFEKASCDAAAACGKKVKLIAVTDKGFAGALKTKYEARTK